jgi:hypothetical protein
MIIFNGKLHKEWDELTSAERIERFGTYYRDGSYEATLMSRHLSGQPLSIADHKKARRLLRERVL